MSISALPGDTFTARSRADSGLVGVIGVRIRDESGHDILARRTTGILEDIAGSGIYRTDLVAPSIVGEYDIVWDTGTISPSTVTQTRLVVSAARPQPEVVDGSTDQNYVPSVDLVARKISSRTRDEYGNVLGIFTEATTPTDDQVQDIVFDVIGEVAGVVGNDVPDPLISDAANVVAERAAMQVELNFFSDQVNTGRSIYPQLKEMYESDLARLGKAITEYDATGSVLDTGMSNRASGSFPAPMTTMTERW